MPEMLRAWRWIAIGLLLLVLVGVGLYAASNTIVGSDLWWAMATGRYITEQHEVPHQDIFSYTYPGAPWFNQEWLTQLVFFHLYRLFGGDGVAVLKIAVVLTLFLLAAWIGWRRSGSLFWTVIATFAGALVCRTFLDIRPQLFTFLGTLVVMAITEAFRRGARSWVLAFLPLTLLLWVNLHFGFIFGLGALGLIAGCELLKSLLGFRSGMQPKRAFLLVAAAIASALVCFLNPQHVHAFTFPFTIADSTTPWRMISEWLATKLFVDEAFNPALFGYTFVGAIVAFGAALVIAPRKIDLTDLALVVVTAVMALKARRFIPLFTLVSTPFVATCLAIVAEKFAAKRKESRELDRPLFAIPAAALALAGLVSLGWTFTTAVRPRFASGLLEGMIYMPFFPKDAVEFLRRNPLPCRMYNLYNWGGYLEYWLPERKVFIDGRAHTVYPPDFYLKNIDVYSAAPNWESILDSYEVNLVLWPSPAAPNFRDYTALPAMLQRSPNWKLVYTDSVALVYAHVARGRDWVEKAAASTLVLPESAEYTLYLFNKLFSSTQFERARVLGVDIVKRFPASGADLDASRRAALKQTGGRNDASLWFQAAFLSDVLGDRQAALEQFTKAIERSLQEPYAAHARQRLEELRK